MLITEAYKQLNAELHKTNESYGTSGQEWANRMTDLAIVLETQDVLDYGCGKSTLAHNMPFKIKQYDPAVPKYNQRPEPADIVVCTDVLEHVEPECLEYVLDDLESLVKQVGFFTIHTGEAKKTLPDGRNAHLIQESYRWWLMKLLDHFEVYNFHVVDHGIIVFVTKKQKETHDAKSKAACQNKKDERNKKRNKK